MEALIHRPRWMGVLGWLGIAAAIVLVVLGMTACTGPRSMQAQAELEQLYAEITADGIVTEIEGATYAAKVQEVMRVSAEEASQIDWEQLVGTGFAAILGSLGIVRFWRGPTTRAR